MYESKETGSLTHDLNNTNIYDINKNRLYAIKDDIIPGMYITFEKNAKAFHVERKLGSKIVLSSYHYNKK